MIVFIIAVVLVIMVIAFAQSKHRSPTTAQLYSEENREYKIAKAVQTQQNHSGSSYNFELARQDALYAQKIEKRDPLMFPSYKGAISRMNEKDRNAYYKAVTETKEKISSGAVIVNAWYQVIKYEHYAKIILKKALKQKDETTARNAAMTLFYTIVCRAAVLTDNSTLPNLNLWLAQYGVACLNLTYYRIGRIVGKRGTIYFEDSLTEEYSLIEMALGKECEKPSTNWIDIRQLAQNVSYPNLTFTRQ